MTRAVYQRRHHEWALHQLRWRWLLDSWEGGEAYRMAEYGNDQTYGLPVRNLIRHKREYPDPRERTTVSGRYFVRQEGTDPNTNATDDDYTLRLARTPVPTIMAERVESHLATIFSREVERETTSLGIADWWSNVDGKGTSMDQWMTDTVAPLLLVMGCLDILCDHPQRPKDVEVQSRADEQMFGLNRCVASIILPENMMWWALDSRDDYLECLVCEKVDSQRSVYRHWTAESWTLYDHEGEKLDEQPHPFGRVPIRRVFDRKRPRCKNVGLPRYEPLAELQREFYNRDSELILSDTTQAHPLLQGPEDYIEADGSIPIGPSWLLPKKKSSGGGAASYEGFDVIEFPKAGADSIRQNLGMLIDRADRAAMMTKPAGAQGTTGNTVSQSGVSKRLDQSGGNNLLAKIAGTLQRAEEIAVDLTLLVLGNGTINPADREGTKIGYPRSFDLMTADELATAIGEFQSVLSAAGACPETEQNLICRLIRLMLPGLDDEEYDEMDVEIETYLQAQATDRQRRREGMGTQGMSGAMNDGTGTGPDSEPDDSSESGDSGDAGNEPDGLEPGGVGPVAEA